MNAAEIRTQSEFMRRLSRNLMKCYYEQIGEPIPKSTPASRRRYQAWRKKVLRDAEEGGASW